MKRFIQDAIINTGLFLAKKANKKQPENIILQQENQPANQNASVDHPAVQITANVIAGILPLVIWVIIFLFMVLGVLWHDFTGDFPSSRILFKYSLVGSSVSFLLACFSFTKVMPIRIDAVLMIFFFIGAFLMGTKGLVLVRWFLILQIGILLYAIIKLLYCLGNRVLGNEDSL